jgi:hypothetical protein
VEERVKRLERSNGMLSALLAVLVVLTIGSRVKDSFSGGTWLTAKGVTAEEMTTKHLLVTQMATPDPSLRVQLLSLESGTFLSLSGHSQHEILGVGIRKDAKLGELPYISFRTKAGIQVLEPNADGKVAWVTKPLPAGAP